MNLGEPCRVALFAFLFDDCVVSCAIHNYLLPEVLEIHPIIAVSELCQQTFFGTQRTRHIPVLWPDRIGQTQREHLWI
jgi:hypothetical protein